MRFFVGLLVLLLLMATIITALSWQWATPTAQSTVAHGQTAPAPTWLATASRIIGQARVAARRLWYRRQDPADLAALADAAAGQYGVDAKLFRALVYYESSWQTHAVSPKGAVGLAQLMPETAKEECGLDADQLRNPAANLNCGAKYLAKQIQRFGDVRQALCAYNAGPSITARLGRCPDYAETQRYVHHILTRWEKYP